MDPNLKVLKKLFEAQRVENENKKKEEELYSLTKKICEIKRNLNDCKNESARLRNENNSLEREIANLKIGKEIIDNEVGLIEKSIAKLTEELKSNEGEIFVEKEKFWSQIDSFVNDVNCFIEDEKNLYLLSKERDSLEQQFKEKMLKLKKLQGKFRGMELYEKLQNKRLKQIEMVNDAIRSKS